MRSKACPYIRFIYLEIDGETVRIGPRVFASELIEKYKIREVKVKTYTVRGVKEPIVSDLTIELDEDLTVHKLFSKQSSDFADDVNFLQI
jgi:hypothetical protein